MTRHVQIPSGQVFLRGDLVLPEPTSGTVLFAHGSGSGRLSSRNQAVARSLNERGFATLLIDLLTEEEEEEERYSRHHRFDIGLLIDRLSSAIDYLRQDPMTQALPVGLFGASTGAAAALGASIKFSNVVKAIVSRGGRPDLAGSALPHVTAPTLLIVGSKDEPVIDLNAEATREMTCPTETVIVEGATHLFEEPGKLEEVARLSGDWFERYLI